MGEGFAFDVELRRGAGAYICGEETALFNSIEGKRGEPRNKPPFPVERGLFGKPTGINNVETLVNVLEVLAHRRRRRTREIGTPDSTGTRLFCLSGRRRAPRRVRGRVRHHAARAARAGRRRPRRQGAEGGPARRRGGRRSSTPDDLDLPLTFEGARAAGVTLGSGVVMVFDEDADLVDIVLRIAAFFRDESCGQCVPCRVGTVRQEEALAPARSPGRTIGSRERRARAARRDRRR